MLIKIVFWNKDHYLNNRSINEKSQVSEIKTCLGFVSPSKFGKPAFWSFEILSFTRLFCSSSNFLFPFDLIFLNFVIKNDFQLMISRPAPSLLPLTAKLLPPEEIVHRYAKFHGHNFNILTIDNLYSQQNYPLYSLLFLFLGVLAVWTSGSGLWLVTLLFRVAAIGRVEFESWGKCYAPAFVLSENRHRVQKQQVVHVGLLR